MARLKSSTLQNRNPLGLPVGLGAQLDTTAMASTQAAGQEPVADSGKMGSSYHAFLINGSTPMSHGLGGPNPSEPSNHDQQSVSALSGEKLAFVESIVEEA